MVKLTPFGYTHISGTTLKAEFSEFSYGYAVVDAYRMAFGTFLTPPRFPSLIEEGITGGYDVELYLPTRIEFLQFKLSECMVNSNAIEIQHHAGKGFHNPTYRMKIHRTSRSNQHSLLLNLETQWPGGVFYVAPMFHTQQEFEDRYQRNRILHESVFISPAAIGQINDDEQHHVSFTVAMVANNQAFFFSDPTELRARKGDDEHRQTREVTSENFNQIFEYVTGEPLQPDKRIRLSHLRKLSRQASLKFGCTTVVKFDTPP